MGRLARASGSDDDAKNVRASVGCDLHAKPLGRAQYKHPDGIRVAQDGVGGFKFLTHFVGFQGTLGEAGAIFLFPRRVEVPALVQGGNFGNFQAKFHLRHGFLHGAATEKQRLQDGLGHCLAFFRHWDVRAKRLMNLAGLVEQDTNHNTVNGIVRAEIADGFDGLRQRLAVTDPRGLRAVQAGWDSTAGRNEARR